MSMRSVSGYWCGFRDPEYVRNDQFGYPHQFNPGPAIARSGIHLFFGNALLLRVDKRSDFIALNPTNAEIANMPLVVLGASATELL